MRFYNFNGLAACSLIASIGMLTLSANADVLQLINGDQYSGTVISMTTSNLQFQSEIQGLVKIPRDKVANITLRPVTQAVPGKSVTVQPTAPNVLGRPATGVSGVPALASGATNAPAANDALKQLKAQGGVDPKMADDLQKQLMGSSDPAVTKMFNEMVGGLMNGKLSINDIKAQARSSINQIQAAKKDLGGDADANEVLDGYVGILEKFLSEAGETDADASKKAAPTK
jgi:hypothetical protein